MNGFSSDLSSVQALLRVLSDGQFHSGQELGEELGISRAAVWKQLQKLELLGVTLIAVKGKGYSLDAELNLLDAEEIKKNISPEVLPLLTLLDIEAVVDSTNIRAMQNATKGYVCIAEHQTSGRGRRGRQWVSPFGKNIYLSLVWQYEGAAALEGLSLAVGVAIAKALRAYGFPGVQLKWPNDVLWSNRKLAGVLLEMAGDPSGACRVVVGIGINVAMQEYSGSSIDQPWVDLQTISNQNQDAPEKINRNKLVGVLLSELLPVMETYASKKFIFYRDSWMGLNAHSDKSVEVRAANKVTHGKMLGVNESGALRLLSDSGELFFYGGEVSLRCSS